MSLNFKVIFFLLLFFVIDLRALKFFEQFIGQEPGYFSQNMLVLDKGALFRKWNDCLNKDHKDLLAKKSSLELAEFFKMIINFSCSRTLLFNHIIQSHYTQADSLGILFFKCLDSQYERIKIAKDFVKLNMCNCEEASFFNRIIFVFHVMQDVAKKYPDPSKKLVYTSLGSGSLLQDFMSVLGLIFLGYNNLELNFIDHEYTDSNLKMKETQHVFNKMIEFYVDNFKKKSDSDFFLNLNKSPCYFKDIYEYIEAVNGSKKDRSNIFVTVDWGQAPFYEIGDLLKNDEVDFSKVHFLNFLKSDSVNFFVEISRVGPLNFIWGVKDKDASKLICILDACQNEVASFIGTENFSLQFLKYLKTKYQIQLQNEFDKIFYESSRPFDWKFLIDQTGIKNTGELVIYQLTRNIITPRVKDDTEDLVGFEKIFLDQTINLVKSSLALKDKLIELKGKLVLIQQKLQDLKDALIKPKSH